MYTNPAEAVCRRGQPTSRFDEHLEHIARPPTDIWEPLSKPIHLCLHTHMYVYIYICMHTIAMHVYVHVYIYIYTY